jgi:hypothetical protein
MRTKPPQAACYTLAMQPDTTMNARLEAIEKKIDAIYESAEKTRKYFLWTLIITVALFILPLIGLVFAVPSFINTYTTTLQGLGS